jgi:hypothetical protein
MINSYCNVQDVAKDMSNGEMQVKHVTMDVNAKSKLDGRSLSYWMVLI